MQLVKIPLTIDPKKAAKMRSEYFGKIESANLPRLLDASAGFCSDIQVQFSCDTDEQGIVTVTGHSQAEVSLICQRCMEEFNITLQVEFCYSPVTDQSQESELPDVYDPVEVDEHGHIEIAKLIEDEFIVSIPFFPMHAVEDCSVKEQDVTVGEIDDTIEERPNPFAVLQKLKK
ncbi:23S rRNA accumulation protein YceD [Psychrobium sp. 1_MG-2023]|uniref:23S rRNA accumulation protein YceD n=1 Tax=Psychrobium sp. 1_MG-2023 TaxID=3062624 RepID=UPI000C34E27B|nr:23S rRNA accumulation protein YceD [Psychrobium sp. 1_MG-2023]MDP2562314.1 23S rRNA accumulation protein YceD [Psychrobium sp. 1_MG-2023]PKF58076.1 23S rRNA accumulation protein YceD [Alteromonadales bacterium alter-6D02]